MTPRPRKRGHKDLPANLYSNNKGSLTYYRYKHPQTGKFTGVGRDKLKAIAAARQLNQLLLQDIDLVSKIVVPDNSFRDYLDYFRDEVLPKKKHKGHLLAQTTKTEYRRIIGCISRELGHLDIKKISQKDIADYLKTQSTAETYNKHRSLLIFIFKYIVSDGIVQSNLPEMIIKSDTDRPIRDRLSLEQYRAVYKHATPAIQNAMELSLNTIQRRTDIKNWRYDYLDSSDGCIYLIQSKTRKYGKAAFLRIPMSLPIIHSERGVKTLSELIDSCRGNNTCPYVIHRAPKRRGHEMAKEKSHIMQLTVDDISRGFEEARKLSGIQPSVGMTPPTFHELLSLGEFLRKKAGWSMKQLQILRGHSKEAMTVKYIDGHEYTTVDIPK